MSGSVGALAEFAGAYAAARADLATRLGRAGLALLSAEAVEGGAEWAVRVRIGAPAGARVATEIDTTGPAETSMGNAGRALPARLVDAESEIQDEPTARAAAVERRPGDTLSSMAAREAVGLMVAHTSGEGGLAADLLSAQERIRMLASTLVGDAFLDLRHRGVDEADEFAVAEVVRQFGLYSAESERLVASVDPTPFLAALDAWAPPSFPRGRDFLDRAR